MLDAVENLLFGLEIHPLHHLYNVSNLQQPPSSSSSAEVDELNRSGLHLFFFHFYNSILPGCFEILVGEEGRKEG